MRAFIGIFLLHATILGADKAEIPIKYQQPSTIATSISVLLDGFVVESDDLRSVIILNGPPEEMDRARKIVSRFDIKPMQVFLRYRLHNSVSKVSCEGTATVSNNDQFGFSSSLSTTKVEVRPRISETGTISFLMRVTFGLSRFEQDITAKSGEQIVVEISKMKPANTEAVAELRTKVPRQFPRLSLSAAVVVPTKK